jgi:carbamate kinase
LSVPSTARSFRRVVPSPVPLEILPKEIIKLLVANDIVVIAAGGGGIPVYRESSGWLEGIDGVIDKDLASAVLAKDVAAQDLIILTGVDKVALNFGKKNQIFLDSMTIAEAKLYMAEGHFPSGSMGAKMQAAINFLENGGEKVIITSIAHAVAALHNKNGTHITYN